MKKSIVVAIITTAGAIICAGIAAKSSHELETQNKYIQSQVANVEGDNNSVTINNVNDLVDEYNKLASKNQILEAQNEKYFIDLTETDNKNKEMENQIKDIPDIKYSDLSLLIDGSEITINKKHSMVTIDGVNYYSEEIVRNLVDQNKNITINTEGIYIGRVIKEQSTLSSEWVVHSAGVENHNNLTDSYGNVYSDALQFGRDEYVIYNVKNNYSYLRGTISIQEGSNLKLNGVITIKADDILVYTSPVLDKTTKPYVIIDLPINNCTLLEISYNSEGWGQCILSDVMVYN